MTRKHFNAIASAIAAEYTAHHATAQSRDALESVMGVLAAQLARDNPRFNRSRFLAACKGE